MQKTHNTVDNQWLYISTNKDTSQHASTNNITGIHYNNLGPQMGASLCVLLHTQGTLARSPLSLLINEFLFVWVYQGVVPQYQKPLCTRWLSLQLQLWGMPLEGVAAVSSKPLAWLTLARGSRKQAHTSKDCMDGDLHDKKHRKGQAIKMHHSTLDGLHFK